MLLIKNKSIIDRLGHGVLSIVSSTFCVVIDLY